MSYEQALEERARHRSWWMSSQATQYAALILDEILDEEDVNRLPAARKRRCQEMVSAIHSGDVPTYFVTRDIVELIHREAKDIPLTALTEDEMPSASGYVLFEGGIPIEAMPLGPADDRVPVESVSLKREEQRSLWKDERMTAVCWNSGYDGVLVIGYAGVRLRIGVLAPWTLGTWPWGVASERVRVILDGRDDVTTHDLERAAHDQAGSLRYYMSAFWAFCQQRIVRIAPERITDRASRRRVSKELNLTDPTVSVVRLRALDYSHDRPTGDGEPVEWQHKWKVRAHWRLQPYKSSGTVKKIRIQEYVKGDLSKPWMPDRVYGVLR